MNNTSAQPSKSLFGAGLLAALAASLCCITPLLAMVAGLGGAASAFAWLEPYRLYLVALTVAVLGLAWYRQLRPVTAAADCCAVAAKRSVMQSTAFLVIVTVLAAGLLAFPYYGAKLYPAARPSLPAGGANGAALWQTKTYRIGGMTCEACARHVEQAVQRVPGVQAVAVSYDQATAQVRFDASHVQPVQVERAINGTGYHVLPLIR
jgi:mercuric ion transport protein